LHNSFIVGFSYLRGFVFLSFFASWSSSFLLSFSLVHHLIQLRHQLSCFCFLGRRQLISMLSSRTELEI